MKSAPSSPQTTQAQKVIVEINQHDNAREQDDSEAKPQASKSSNCWRRSAPPRPSAFAPTVSCFAPSRSGSWSRCGGSTGRQLTRRSTPAIDNLRQGLSVAIADLRRDLNMAIDDLRQELAKQKAIDDGTVAELPNPSVRPRAVT
jgi:hypothetical protein